MRSKVITCGLALVLLMFPFMASADVVEAAGNVGEQKILAGKQSQQKINQLADESDAMLQQYRAALKQTESLKVYNQQLTEQLAHQLQQLEEMKTSTAQAKVMGREISPLLKAMLESLETFVAQDLPFHREERSERLQFLRNNLNRSDLSIAEKFRQVLEAYKIELEYGQKIDSYEASVQVFNHKTKTLEAAKEMNVLRIGRIALLSQTKDGKQSAAWNPSLQGWQEISESEITYSINKGLQITRNQAPIDLLSVPLFVAELKQELKQEVKQEVKQGVAQ